MLLKQSPNGLDHIFIERAMHSPRTVHEFMNKLTLLLYHGNKMGIMVEKTPKCHPKVAGEGLE